MKKWILKAIIQKVITYLPFSFHFNYFFQKYITRSVRLSNDFFEIMLTHFAEFNEYSNKHQKKFIHKKALELGTGWHPIMPMCLYLAGCEEIHTVDLRCLLRKENLKTLLDKLITYHDNGKLQKFIPNIQEERIDQLKKLLANADQLTITEILQKFNITQTIMDAQQMDFKDDDFDFTYSVNVLEHVNGDVIEGISKEFYRVLKVKGLAYHAIGVYDHFVHVDNNISKFNYLKYSEKQWRFIDNGIQPQNRKRISHFREIFIQEGYTILDEIFWEAEPLELAKIKVHPDFKDQEDIDIPYGTFILSK